MERARNALWLIDAAYLMNSRRSVNSAYNFDYRKLKEHVRRQCGELYRACFLNSEREEAKSPAEMSFLVWLNSPEPRGVGIEVHLFPLKKASVDRVFCEQCSMKVDIVCPHGAAHTFNVETQKRVDVALATFILGEMERYDCLVLSSGDGDLLPAIEVVKGAGKPLRLVVFRAGVSSELREKADQVLWINDFAKDVAKSSW